MFSVLLEEEIKQLIPGFPSHHHGLGRSATKRDKFLLILQQHGLQELVNQYGLFDVYYLIANKITDPKVCQNPSCNNVIIRKTGSKYCSMKCYKSDEAAGKRIGAIKTQLYSDPLWKERTEKKKRDTCRKNHGADFPMQVLEIFEKHEKSSMQATNYRGINGVRGYEPTVIDYFVDKGLIPGQDIISGPTAMRQNGWKFIGKNNNRLYPDLYIPLWHTFVEVKSEYTLSKDLGKIQELPEIIDIECGADYEVLLVTVSSTISSVSLTNNSIFENRFNCSEIIHLGKIS